MTKRGEPAEELRLTIQPAPGANDSNAKYRLNVLELFESFLSAGKVVRAPVTRKKRAPHRYRSSINQAGILAAIKRGEYRADIAKKYKCSSITVTHIASDNGVRCKRRGSYHGRRPAFTVEQVAELKEARASGARVADLAERFHVTKMTVWRYSKENKKRKKVIADGPLTPEQVEKARQLLEGDMTLADCAIRFGTNSTTLRRYGLRPKKKWNLIEQKNRKLEGPRKNAWRGWSMNA